MVESLAPKKLKVLSIPIDINTASAEELDTLPGIGPKTAQAILEHRQTYGKFALPEDLMNVRGIGPKKFAAIRPHIVVK
jgi:competence protein ComEA